MTAVLEDILPNRSCGRVLSTFTDVSRTLDWSEILYERRNNQTWTRSRRKYARLPLIVLTGHGSQRSRRMAQWRNCWSMTVSYPSSKNWSSLSKPGQRCDSMLVVQGFSTIFVSIACEDLQSSDHFRWGFESCRDLVRNLVPS